MSKRELDAKLQRYVEGSDPPRDLDVGSYPPSVTVGVGSRSANGGYTLEGAGKTAGSVMAIRALVIAIAIIPVSLVAFGFWLANYIDRYPTKAYVDQKVLPLTPGEKGEKSRLQVLEDAKETHDREAKEQAAQNREMSQQIKEIYESGLQRGFWGPTHPAPPSLASPRGAR